MLSGGSPASTSVISAALTVTVHWTPMGRSEVGLSVKVLEGLAESAKACVLPGVGHSMEKELVVAFTLSLKLTTMLTLAATPVAPLVGVVVVTDGGESTVNEKTWSA